MTSEKDVSAFLEAFKVKMKVWQVLFRDDRGKNMQTLLDLELKPADRVKVLEALEISNYSQGPVPDDLHKGPEMWVFGSKVKNREVYIKITMGLPGTSVICISFHLATYNMTYPFKAMKT